MAMMTEMKTQGVSVRRILGKDVVGQGRDKIGEIDDVILNPTSGCAMFAIVDEGGFLGMAERHHVVPWEAFSWTAEERLMVPFDQMKLKDAPTFDRGSMPDWGNESWQRSIYDYYGIQHRGMMSGSTTSRAGMSERERMGGGMSERERTGGMGGGTTGSSGPSGGMPSGGM